MNRILFSFMVEHRLHEQNAFSLMLPVREKTLAPIA
jgi:hypothetical protein